MGILGYVEATRAASHSKRTLRERPLLTCCVGGNSRAAAPGCTVLYPVARHGRSKRSWFLTSVVVPTTFLRGPGQLRCNRSSSKRRGKEMKKSIVVMSCAVTLMGCSLVNPHV